MAENKLDKVQLEKHFVTPMTKDQQAEVILQVVREYSDCQQLIGTFGMPPSQTGQADVATRRKTP